MRFLLAAFLTIALAGTAFAGPPATGVYLSLTQGGPVLDGHFSESWMPGGGAGQIGNTINAQSWDMGLGLGTEWRFYCASIAIAPVEIENTVDGTGTGDVVYQTEYAGGLFWLSMNGPWGDATEDYTGQLDIFSVETTYKYVGGTLLGVRSNVTMSGHFFGLRQLPELRHYQRVTVRNHGRRAAAARVSAVPRLQLRRDPLDRCLGRRDAYRDADHGAVHRRYRRDYVG